MGWREKRSLVDSAEFSDNMTPVPTNNDAKRDAVTGTVTIEPLTKGGPRGSLAASQVGGKKGGSLLGDLRRCVGGHRPGVLFDNSVDRLQADTRK